MNRRALQSSLWLAGLLLLSSASVPLAHAAQHRSGLTAPGAQLEAWCDLCHAPFVAVAAALPAALPAPQAVPLTVCLLPAPPTVAVVRVAPRGPPAA